MGIKVLSTFFISIFKKVLNTFLNYFKIVLCVEKLFLYTYYATIKETTPAPTVRPPSRIAKRIPFSIAIG